MTDNREEIVDRTLDILESYLTVPKRTARSMVLSFFDSPYLGGESKVTESRVHNVFEHGGNEDPL